MRPPVADADFPDTPGVYVVYADNERPLYVGVAATQSIRKRWHGQHLKARAGGSALRRTLGVHLGPVATKLRTSQGRYYAPEVEEAITDFLERCQIEFHPAADARAAKALEAELIARLRPTLSKLFGLEAVARVTDRALLVFGGIGYTRATHPNRAAVPRGPPQLARGGPADCAAPDDRP